MVLHHSQQSGDWDDTNTWLEGTFPNFDDNWQINNTHVVKVKGTEEGAGGVINSGGVLEFDGQSNTVPAILKITQGFAIQNDGIIRQTGTGSTGYAELVVNPPGGTTVTMINGMPIWSDGYWKIGKFYISWTLITTGEGCTIELTGSDFGNEGDFIIAFADTFIAGSSNIVMEAFNTFLQGLVGFRVHLIGDFQEGTSHVFFEDDVSAPHNTELYVAKGNRFHDVTVNSGHVVDAIQRVLVEGSLSGSITLSGVSDELISMNDLNVIGTLNARNAVIAKVVKEKREVVRRIRNE